VTDSIDSPDCLVILLSISVFIFYSFFYSYRVAEWLACWTHVQKGLGSNLSLRQTVHTHRASVHQAVKLLAALLRVVRVTAGLAERNGSLPPGL